MHTNRDNFATSTASLAAGTNAGTFKTQKDCSYSIGARAYIKAATDNISVTTGTAQTTLTQCVYWVVADAAGNVTTIQGSIQPMPTVAGYVAGAWEVPHVADKAVVGALKVTLASSATFTPGTTALGATNVTTTYFNFSNDYGTPVTY